jgi:hypothetical protein
MLSKLTASPPRVPAGPVDHEIRVPRRTEGSIPALELQPWRYSLASGTWVREDGPPVIQVHLVAHLCDLLRREAERAAAVELFAAEEPPRG